MNIYIRPDQVTLFYGIMAIFSAASAMLGIIVTRYYYRTSRMSRETSSLIVEVLDTAAARRGFASDDPLINQYADEIRERYSELKRLHDFETASFGAREEIVYKILNRPGE